ncbi:MAG: nitroreductase family protein [Actinomycetota bacterium]
MTEPAKSLHQLLAQRWSPRAFDPEHEVADATLVRLLEAARWAPSAANTQPWRFLVARRGTAAFDRLFAVLAPGNQVWAGRASVLLLVAAETVDPDGRPRTHAGYDTGQAVAHLTVQAQAEGLDVHQMGGFDAPAAAAAFDLPPHLSPVVVVALGRRTHPGTLPEPLAARETAPRTRRPVGELLLPAGDLPLELALSA